MDMQLEHIVASYGVWGGKIEHDGPRVEDGACGRSFVWLVEGAQCSPARREEREGGTESSVDLGGKLARGLERGV